MLDDRPDWGRGGSRQLGRCSAISPGCQAIKQTDESKHRWRRPRHRQNSPVADMAGMRIRAIHREACSHNLATSRAANNAEAEAPLTTTPPSLLPTMESSSAVAPKITYRSRASKSIRRRSTV